MADQYDQKSYPTIVSRTLDPSKKALATIVTLHDHEISDADLNLMQDLQDLKRSQILQDKSCVSGSLTYSPMAFNTGIANSFFIPTFDVLWNNVEILTISGSNSSDQTTNRVTLPNPSQWAPGTLAEDCAIYVVFLEIWYQSLNPITGQGYQPGSAATGNAGLNFFYPYGGVNPDPSNAFSVPDDSIDPLLGDFTTERAQVQWRIQVQRVSTGYNFKQFAFGLDPDTVPADISPFGIPNAVYAQALQNAPIQTQQYTFVNMGGINGDTGLWRAGSPLWSTTVTYGLGDVVTLGGVTYKSLQIANLNQIPTAPNSAFWTPTTVGNVNNSLGTMDGYSYAMPLAVAFQRNAGNFDVRVNIFGCADPTVPNSGTLSSGISGRFDDRLADQVFQDNVVDTRATNTLDAWDGEQLMGFGFGDLVQGKTQLAISRGLSPGNKVEDIGSTLPFYVSMNAGAQIGNVYPAGTFDGYQNGFSSDQRTFMTTFQITTSQKSSLGPGSTQGGSWMQGDTFNITLAPASVGTISDITVTALVSTSPGVKTPAALLQGQVTITGLGTKSVTVTLAANLVGTLFDPGPNNIYATVSVTYLAGMSANLQQIPFTVDGGQLFDSQAGSTLPVYGISEYAVQANQVALPTSTTVTNGVTNVVYPTQIALVTAVNPEYSDIILGTKIWLSVPGAAGVQQTVGGSAVTVFVIPLDDMNGNLGGLYVTQAWDPSTNPVTPYGITSQVMTSTTSGVEVVVSLQGSVPLASTVVFSILAQNTCQIAYNAPVKGVTQIEETVLFGNYTGDPNFPTDTRVVVESISTAAGTTTIVLGANGCTIKGISGNNQVPLIWVNSGTGSTAILTSSVVQSLNFVNDVLVIQVTGVTLTGVGAQQFLFAGSILPSLQPASTLIVELRYIPYQGEGVVGRDYEILVSEDNALITSNGTGAAPAIGLTDVYPYNRELPIVTMLPAQLSWLDSTLTNTALASLFDSNYVAMRQDNVETTFLVPLHTNDFIPPVNKDTRKTIRFLTAGARGFATATPHIGFGITAPTPRTVLGQNLQNTIAPITLYVDNINGNDANSGLSATQAKATFAAALNEMPPVLSFPCVIIMANAVPYTLTSLATPPSQGSLQVVALGDGDIRSAKVYCLGNLSRVIQGEGRLVISQPSGATSPVVIDATGFNGFGDGPTCAFYLDTSRVILNGIQFKNFTSPAVIAYNSDIDMVGCQWVGNAQAGSYTGCDSVILDGGSTSLPDNATGHLCVQSNLLSSNHSLAAVSSTVPPGVPVPGVYYVGSRNSTLFLSAHAAGSASQTDEPWQTPQTTIVVAEAQLNSSIAVSVNFQTNGAAVLQANSVLSQTAAQSPFLGGVTADASSSVVTQV
jgi:hypothetical protein